MTKSADPWESGTPYENFMGRWSRLVAQEFLAWLNEPPARRWLDVGCGTGALTAAILAQSAPARVVGVDPAEPFVAFARHTVPDPRADFRVGDALNLPVDSGDFEVVVSGLALNFIPDALAALGEMARAAGPGGRVAAYVWDYAGKMEMLRYFWDAAVALNPAAAPLDEGPRFPLCQPAALESLFNRAGLQAIAQAPLEVATIFQDFNDFWQPFLGQQGPAPGYVKSLAADQRAALEERLQKMLPVQPDGAIALIARAWAISGQAR